MSWQRKRGTDGPTIRFTYFWRGRWPVAYELDFSGTNCDKTVDWERVGEEQILDRGQIKRYEKGHRIRISLDWGRGALVAPQYWDVDNYWGRNEKIIRLLYNTPCHQQILIWPWPGAHCSSYYNVAWDGGFDFNYVKGLEKVGFRGSMRFIGKDVLQEIPPLDYSSFRGNWPLGIPGCDDISI